MKKEIQETKHRLVYFSNGKDGWHLVVARDDRIPSFMEVKRARYKYIPDEVHMAMMFPPKKEYVNVHPYALHLFQIYPTQVK